MGDTSQGSNWPLGELFFYLTEECNLRCRHCWISPRLEGAERPQSHLDSELLAAIIEQALPLGLSGVKLSGGEPLLHPKITEILRSLKAKNLRLTLETNGVLCTRELADILSASGGAFVSVSLDGADAATHEWVRGVGGCFDAALQGVRNLVEAGLKPQIVYTLMRRNAGQMEEVVRLAEGLGAASVKFNLLQPTERGALLHQTNEVLSAGELVELGRWVETQLFRSTRLQLFFHHPPAFRPLSRLFGDGSHGCSVCGIKRILGVLHDGSYALCGIGESTPDLILGHAAKVRLDEIWHEHPLLREIRTGLPKRLEGICADCLMKEACLGSCVAQNYYRHGHLWGPFWFCEQALKENAFPETRLKPRMSSRALRGSMEIRGSIGEEIRDRPSPITYVSTVE